MDDNRLKEAKTIVFEYADSKLPRQGNEEQPPNVNQQRLHSERPPSEVVQAIGKFSQHITILNKICSKTSVGSNLKIPNLEPSEPPETEPRTYRTSSLLLRTEPRTYRTSNLT